VKADIVDFLGTN